MLQNYRSYVQIACLASILAGSPAGAQEFQPPELPGKPAPRSSKIYEPLNEPQVNLQDPMATSMNSVFEQMERMQREMDALFNSHMGPFGRPAPMPHPGAFSRRSPLLSFEHRMQSVNFRDDGKHYVAELQLPGQSGADVDVKVDGRMLTIRSKHESRKEENRQGFASRHQSSSSFQQSVSLPGPVRSEQMQVEHHKDGRITIRLPKA